MIQWSEVAVSTMDDARRLWAAGAPHGVVAAAHSQSAGRGRGGHAWVSPPGNLHATVLLRVAATPRHAPELGFVAALAVARAVDALAGGTTSLKWPNDVMRHGAKLAGLLLERLADGAVLLGLGVNVQHCPAAMPYPVTSLALQGCTTTPPVVLDAVLAQLRPAVAAWQADGFAPVAAQWLARGPPIGAPLRVRTGDATVEGHFAGLAPGGALLLDVAGTQRVIVAGDVQPYLRPPLPATTSGAC